MSKTYWRRDRNIGYNDQFDLIFTKTFILYNQSLCSLYPASSNVRAKLRKKLLVDQTQINKRTSLHNEMQLALGEENVHALDLSSIVDAMFPWTLNGIVYSCSNKIEFVVRS